uniref:RNA-directed RNA polymerase n=1 Tax=Leviviridae sp. TaxID=2027243 RepID=A0A142D847_9VIRU|nr:replicase [Leviviridae sp.]
MKSVPKIRFSHSRRGDICFAPRNASQRIVESQEQKEYVIEGEHDYCTIVDSALSVFLFTLDHCSVLGNATEKKLFDKYVMHLTQLSYWDELWCMFDTYKAEALDHLSGGTHRCHLHASGLSLRGIFQYLFNHLLNGWIDVYSICCFIAKTRVQRPDQEQEQMEHFVQYQLNELPQKKISDWALGLIAQKYRKHPLPFEQGAFLPKHGPGAVNPSVDTFWDKQEQFLLTKYTKYWLKDKWQIPFFLNGVQPSELTVDSVSKLCCVPKNWKKPRTIASEPISNQYLQQGLEHMFDYAFSSDPWWRRRINLHDAERGAKRSMNYRSYATIDLSSASDDVRKQHVDAVFKNTPWRRALHAVRSRYCRVDERTIKLESFSTMGSATCFPVETVIFLLACEVACDLSDTRRHCIVFGDDMVVPVEAYDMAILILELLGFTVNTEKSYGVSLNDYGLTPQHPELEYFREACGTHSYRGSRIALVYLRESFINKHFLQPEEYCTCVDTLSNLSVYRRCFSYFWKGMSNAKVKGCANVRFADLVPFADLDTHTEFIPRDLPESLGEVPRCIAGKDTYLYHTNWFKVGVVIEKGKPVHLSNEAIATYDEESRYQAWLYDHASDYDLRHQRLSSNLIAQDSYSSELAAYNTWLYKHRREYNTRFRGGRTKRYFEPIQRSSAVIARVRIDNSQSDIQRFIDRQWPTAVSREIIATTDIKRGFRTHKVYTVCPKRVYQFTS